MKMIYIIRIWIFGLTIAPVALTPIFGGDVVKSNGTLKYPYVVSLQQKSFENNQFVFKHFCGGSLLNSNWILSAGHCLWDKKAENIYAVIGEENIANVLPEHRLKIDWLKFNHFQPTSLRNDIVLLRLQKPYEPFYTQLNIKELFGKLPRYGMKASRRNPCKVIGFGAINYAGLIQEQLREADVYVISNKKCRLLMGNIWAPQNGDNTICALGNEQDTCQGDSGGPLICQYKGRDYIYGIISYGLGCGLKGVPGIYTITGPYIEWIKFVINDYKL